MKRFLLTFLCVCLFLALPVFAQDQPKPDQNELIQASILKPWTGDFDGMIRTPRDSRPCGTIPHILLAQWSPTDRRRI